MHQLADAIEKLHCLTQHCFIYNYAKSKNSRGFTPLFYQLNWRRTINENPSFNKAVLSLYRRC